MLKILPKTSHQLSICESNFLRLKKVLQNFKKYKYIFETINPNQTSNPILFNLEKNGCQIISGLGQQIELTAQGWESFSKK